MPDSPSVAAALPIDDKWHSETALYGQAVDVLSGLLTDSARYVETNTQELSSRFSGLADSARRQGEQIQKMIDTGNVIEVNGEQIPLEEFIRLFGDILSDMIGKISYVSEKSNIMLTQIEDAVARIAEINTFMERIKKINRQTNLLALNAMIEAARTGEEGKGFAVVAGEVKEVAKTIERFTDDIETCLSSVTTSMRQSQGIVRQIAETDISGNLRARERLNTLMDGMVRQKGEFHRIMQDAVNNANETSVHISRAVISLQFQDRNSQYVENAVNIFRHFFTHLSAHPVAEKPDGSAVLNLTRFICGQFKLTEFRNAFMQRLLDRAWIKDGDIAEHMPAQANDDVELF